ncbi:MAG: type II toxin-antitoxin system RelE/ParE family toxin [Candidatus Firestonebacteria bacterium]
MAYYNIIIKEIAQKDIRHLDKPLIKVIINKIKNLSENTRPQGTLKLSGEENRWRLRIGDYRILYEIDDKAHIVTIYRVRHRKEVYRQS